MSLQVTLVSTNIVTHITRPSDSIMNFFFMHLQLPDCVCGIVASYKYSLVQNNTNAYVSTSSITQTGNSNHITVDGTIESGTTVKLLGTGTSTLNSASWYRIGLGDTTTTDTVDTNASTLVVPTVTSSGTVLDSYSRTD